MAKASATQAERIITLELTEAEATAVATVFDYVGGSPKYRRGLIDQVRKALNRVGIEAKDEDDVSGAVTLDAAKTARDLKDI